MAGRTIYGSLWAEPWFVAYSPEAKLLFLYFCTSPLTNPAGMYLAAIGVILADTGLSEAEFLAALAEIDERASYCENVVWVRNWLRIQNHAHSPKFLSAALKTALTGPPRFLRSFLAHNRALLADLAGYPTDTLSIPYPYPTDRVPIPPARVSGSGSGSGSVPDSLRALSNSKPRKPKRVNTLSPEQTAAKQAAIDLYLERLRAHTGAAAPELGGGVLAGVCAKRLRAGDTAADLLAYVDLFFTRYIRPDSAANASHFAKALNTLIAWRLQETPDATEICPAEPNDATAVANQPDAFAGPDGLVATA